MGVARDHVVPSADVSNADCLQHSVQSLEPLNAPPPFDATWSDDEQVLVTNDCEGERHNAETYQMEEAQMMKCARPSRRRRPPQS